MSAVSFEVTADNSDLIKKLKEAQAQIERMAQEAKNSGTSLNGLFGNLTGVLGLTAGIEGVRQFARAIIDVRSQIETYEISLKTLLGSSQKATEMMDVFRRIASQTPLSLDTLAGGAQTLLGFGVASDKVIPSLMQLGDISGGNAERFRSLALAFAQASSAGRLMGQDLLQMINAGFNPLAQISKDTGKSMAELREMMSQGAISVEMLEGAFRNATKEGGQYHGMLEAQGEGFRGSLNALSGAWQQMLNEIGQSGAGLIKGSAEVATTLVRNYERVGEALGVIIATYGVYKAALIATNLAHSVAVPILQTYATQLATTTASGLALTKAQAMQATATTLLRTATQRLHATLTANPYALVAIALVALTYAIYKLVTAQTAQERAQERVNNQLKEQRDLLASNRQEMERSLGLLRDETTTSLQRLEAWERLRRLAPEITKHYTAQELATMDLSKAQQLLNKAQDEAQYEALKKNVADATAEYERLVKEYNQAVRAIQASGRGGLLPSTSKIDEAKERLHLLTGELERYEEQAKRANMKPAEILIKVKNDAQEADRVFNDLKRRIEEFERSHSLVSLFANPEYNMLRVQYSVAGKHRERTQEALREAEHATPQAPTVAQQVAHKRKEVAELERKLAEQRRASSKATQADIEQTTKALQEAHRALELLTGEKRGKGTQEGGKRAREKAELRELEAQHMRERARAIIDAEHTLEALIIETISHQGERERAQHEHEHRKRLELIKRQEEDALLQEQERVRTLFDKNPRNKDKVFDPSGVTLTDETKRYYRTLEALEHEHYNRITAKRLEDERLSMNDYLKEHGTYLDKRNALIQEADGKLKQATTEGERLAIRATLEIDLSKLDTEANKATQIISRIFTDTAHLSSRQIRAMTEEAKSALAYLSAGTFQTDKEGRGLFGITAEQFEQLRKSPEQIKAIKDEVQSLEDTANRTDHAFNQIGIGIRQALNAGANAQRLKAGLDLIQQGVGQVSNGVGVLADSFGALAELTGSEALEGMAQGLQLANDAMSSAMQGAQAGAMFGPIGAGAGAALGAITALAKGITDIHDKKHERRIQELGEQIERLDKSYQQLDKAIGKAFSHDASAMMRQQETLLRQKQQLLRLQIQEEQSKKKADKSKVQGMRDEYNDINEQIADNKDKAVDAIFGADLKSAVNEFAQAYAEAWASGQDRAQSSKDMVTKMIKQMVTESLKAATSKPMEALRKKIAEAWHDEFITPQEEMAIEKLRQDLTNEMEAKTAHMQKWLKDDSQETISAQRGGFQTMSQDTGRELSGRFASVQQSMLMLVEGTQAQGVILDDLRTITALSSQHLERIASHTKHLGDMHDRLVSIERNTRALG